MKKKKKIGALFILAAMLLSTVAACGSPLSEQTADPSAAAEAAGQTASEPPISGTVAVLSQLNLTEDEYSAMLNGKYRASAYVRGKENGTEPVKTDLTAKYYETLDAQILALEAGEVRYAEVPYCVAQYLCAHNDRITCDFVKRTGPGTEGFAGKVYRRSQVGLSFMMLEKNTALRDEFDQALADMKSDGTLDSLIREYITDAADDEAQKVVAFETFDGDAIRIGVTGSLPPLDYIAPDGTPAGFNTAILAEIGKRTGRRIELVQVDSIGRATALSTGTVDAVLWTRVGNGRAGGNYLTNEVGEEFQKFVEEKREEETPEEIEIMENFTGGISHERDVKRDVPDGVIITEPYYTDPVVLVSLK